MFRNQAFLKKIKSIVGVAGGGTLAFGTIGVWTGNEKFFQDFLNPVFNRVDPELSHRSAVFVAKHNLIRAAPPDDELNLKTRLVSLDLKNPVGLAAGFDKSGECLSGLVRVGFGWLEIGSVTPLPQGGNPKPRLFRLPEDSAVINRYGFNNDGHEAVHTRVLEFKNTNPKYPIGINLGANKESLDRVSDYCKGIEAFCDCADYFVINVSSPNTPNLRELQKSENLNELLKKVVDTRNRQERKIPVFLKVAPDLTDPDIKNICTAIKKKETKIEGIIVSNTTISRENLKSENQLQSEVGGLSGKPLAKISTELIGKFYKELNGEIPIIGVGGIWDGRDAYEKICTGASVVQLYTALTYRGPTVIHKVKTELAEILKENGFQSVEEAVGSNHRDRRK